jgi:hypothetical protein
VLQFVFGRYLLLPAGALIALVWANSVGSSQLARAGFATSMGFTLALFAATAVFPIGPLLTETKIGALPTGQVRSWPLRSRAAPRRPLRICSSCPASAGPARSSRVVILF